jgi:hypothetical protein
MVFEDEVLKVVVLLVAGVGVLVVVMNVILTLEEALEV